MVAGRSSPTSPPTGSAWQDACRAVSPVSGGCSPTGPPHIPKRCWSAARWPGRSRALARTLETSSSITRSRSARPGAGSRPADGAASRRRPRTVFGDRGAVSPTPDHGPGHGPGGPAPIPAPTAPSSQPATAPRPGRVPCDERNPGVRTGPPSDRRPRSVPAPAARLAQPVTAGALRQLLRLGAQPPARARRSHRRVDAWLHAAGSPAAPSTSPTANAVPPLDQRPDVHPHEALVGLLADAARCTSAGEIRGLLRRRHRLDPPHPPRWPTTSPGAAGPGQLARPAALPRPRAIGSGRRNPHVLVTKITKPEPPRRPATTLPRARPRRREPDAPCAPPASSTLDRHHSTPCSSSQRSA